MDIIPNEIKKKIFLFWAEHPTAIIMKKSLTILDRGSYSYRIFNINGRKDIIFSEDNSDRDFQEEFWNNLIGYIRLHKELQEHWRISREVDEMSRNDKDVKYIEHKTARILRQLWRDEFYSPLKEHRLGGWLSRFCNQKAKYFVDV
jgi:hypothetical protein